MNKFIVIGKRGGRWWLRHTNVASKEEAISLAIGCANADRCPVKIQYLAAEIISTCDNKAPQTYVSETKK